LIFNINDLALARKIASEGAYYGTLQLKGNTFFATLFFQGQFGTIRLICGTIIPISSATRSTSTNIPISGIIYVIFTKFRV
jgi:hypothetical protein